MKQFFAENLPLIFMVTFFLILLPAVVMANKDNNTSARKNLEAFPLTHKGLVRQVIFLPKKTKEDLLKVELQVGKIFELDTINQYFLMGELQQKILQGWGFSYYVLQTSGDLGGTLMAIHPDTPKEKRFVSLAEETIIRYNSEMPIVVYLPKGFELRYRIWKTKRNFKSLQ